MKRTVILFSVRYLVYFIFDGLKCDITGIVPAMDSKISVVHKLKKVFSIAFLAFCLDFWFIKTKFLLKRACSNL